MITLNGKVIRKPEWEFDTIVELAFIQIELIMADLNNKIYQIKLKGHLSEIWADWFDGLTFTYESDDSTTLSGEIVDQAALHGLLKKIRDLGLPLISVLCVECSSDEERFTSYQSSL